MIPKKYEFLTKLNGPKVLIEALKLVGVREIVGKKHNPVIMSWAEALDIKGIYTSDEIAWCGLAHAIVLIRAGKPLRLKGYDILRAAKYAEFGVAIPIKDMMLGDTVVLKRTGGHHVGVYVAESLPTVKYPEGTVHLLGGNQGNAYGFAEMDMSRVIAVRRPVWTVAQPPEVKKYILDSSGKVSINEA